MRNFDTNNNEFFWALENKLYCLKCGTNWNNCGITTCQLHRHLNPATCPHTTDAPVAERLTVTQQGLCLSSAEVLTTDFACTHTLTFTHTQLQLTRQGQTRNTVTHPTDVHAHTQKHTLHNMWHSSRALKPNRCRVGSCHVISLADLSKKQWLDFLLIAGWHM